MNDLINRKKLLDEIDKMTFHATLSFPLKASKIYEIKSVIQKLLDSVIEIIKNSHSEFDWIPCSDRMPEEWQIVAAYGEKIGLRCVEWHPEMGMFIDTQSEYDEQIKPEYFTRWIPLPEEGDNDA